MVATLALVVSVVALVHTFFVESSKQHCDFLYLRHERLFGAWQKIETTWSPYGDGYLADGFQLSEVDLEIAAAAIPHVSSIKHELELVLHSGLIRETGNQRNNLVRISRSLNPRATESAWQRYRRANNDITSLEFFLSVEVGHATNEIRDRCAE